MLVRLAGTFEGLMEIFEGLVCMILGSLCLQRDVEQDSEAISWDMLVPGG